jgi:hypothetical protein
MCIVDMMEAIPERYLSEARAAALRTHLLLNSD